MANNHVKFISYDGSYPTYCLGNLTLEIDNETVTFGLSTADNMYGLFWSDGIYLRPNFADKLPEKFRKYADEIRQIFENEESLNEGCCGGCE